MSLFAATAPVTVCSRDVVTKAMTELDAGSALCADGDSIAIWMRESDDKISLREVVVASGSDDRNLEVTAARATMALRNAIQKTSPTPEEIAPSGGGAVTIVANPNGGGTTVIGAIGSKDSIAHPPAPVAKAPRIAPRLVLGAGPGLMASRHGTSFAVSLAAEIGFSRTVALVPWINFIPANRTAETTQGSASFRPTLFGLGFSIPLFKPDSFLIPRLGGGYAILWMHTAPETAVPPATPRKPEDLLAPAMYASASLSMKVAGQFRVAAEAMGAVASHEMVVRIARRDAANWGVPMGSLSFRGEWVMP